MLWWALIQLKSKDYKKRALAAEKLGDSGNTRAIDPLIAALEDSNKEVQQKVAKALVALGWQPIDERQKAILFVVLQRWMQLSIWVLRRLNRLLPHLAVTIRLLNAR